MHTTSFYRRARLKSRSWKVDRQALPIYPSSGVLVFEVMIVKKEVKRGMMERLVSCAMTDTYLEIGISCQFIAAQFRFRANCASAMTIALPVGDRVHR